MEVTRREEPHRRKCPACAAVHIDHPPVVAFRPQMTAVGGRDELRRRTAKRLDYTGA